MNEPKPEDVQKIWHRPITLETTVGVLITLGYGLEVIFALARVPGQSTSDDVADMFEARKALQDAIAADKAKFDEETGGEEEWPEHLFGKEVH